KSDGCVVGGPPVPWGRGLDVEKTHCSTIIAVLLVQANEDALEEVVKRVLRAIVDERAWHRTVDGSASPARALGQHRHVMREGRLSGVTRPIRVAVITDLVGLEHD